MGQTDRSKWAGAHESNGKRPSFNGSETEVRTALVFDGRVGITTREECCSGRTKRELMRYKFNPVAMTDSGADLAGESQPVSILSSDPFSLTSLRSSPTAAASA